MKPRPAGSSPTFLPRVIRLNSAVLKRERPVKSTTNAPKKSKTRLTGSINSAGQRIKEDNQNEVLAEPEKEADESITTTAKAPVARSFTANPHWTWRDTRANSSLRSASSFVVDVYWRAYEAADKDENAVDALQEFTEGTRLRNAMATSYNRLCGCTECANKRTRLKNSVDGIAENRRKNAAEKVDKARPSLSSDEIADVVTDEVKFKNEAERVDEACSSWMALENANDSSYEIGARNEAEKVNQSCPPWEPLRDVETDSETMEEKSILTLADELLSRIFMHVSLKDCKHVNLTCRRFRELNLLLGQHRFSSIDIDWKNGLSSVQGLRCGTTWHHFDIQPSPNGDEFEDTIRRCGSEMRIFKHAVADRITVTFQDFDRTPDHPSASMMQKLCESMRYKKLEVCFDSAQDFTEEFYAAFLKNRRLLKIDAPVSISWSARFNHDAEKARKLIKSLPYARRYQIAWKVRNGRMPPHEYILDDVLLRHLILNSDEARTQVFGIYTAHDIMRMFETIDNIKHKNKKISFLVDKKVIRDLYQTNYPLMYNQSVFCKCIENPSTCTCLTATLHTITIERKPFKE